MLAVDHKVNVALACVLGRKDKFFKKLKAMLKLFGIRHFYTYDWGTL